MIGYLGAFDAWLKSRDEEPLAIILGEEELQLLKETLRPLLQEYSISTYTHQLYSYRGIPIICDRKRTARKELVY